MNRRVHQRPLGLPCPAETASPATSPRQPRIRSFSWFLRTEEPDQPGWEERGWFLICSMRGEFSASRTFTIMLFRGEARASDSTPVCSVCRMALLLSTSDVGHQSGSPRARSRRERRSMSPLGPQVGQLVPDFLEGPERQDVDARFDHGSGRAPCNFAGGLVSLLQDAGRPGGSATAGAGLEGRGDQL